MKKTLREWLEMFKEVSNNTRFFLVDSHSKKGKFILGNTNMYYADNLLEICGETRLAMQVTKIDSCVYSSLGLPCLVIYI